MRKCYFVLLTLSLSFAANAQWTSDFSATPTLAPEGTSLYIDEVMVGPGGITWGVMYRPTSVDGSTQYQYRIQALDTDGNYLFDEDECGLLVSNYANKSYTLYGSSLFVDSDDNAIVIVADCRNDAVFQYKSLTAYKISPEGEFLWGDDGVSLDGGATFTVVAGAKACELDDGSIVIAWMIVTDTGYFNIMVQRITSDGELAWDDCLQLGDDSSYYSYPYVVDGGDNQFILVYAKGNSEVVYAQKYDFDKTPAWSDPTRVYRGGFTLALWTVFDVCSSGDGGVLCFWDDDRSSSGTESAYLSYITSDGEIGFSGASDEGDVKLGYSGYRHFNVDATPAPDGDGFIAIWRETSSEETYQGVRAQRVSKTGELEWTDDGLEVVPLDVVNVGYLSVQPGDDSTVGLFYEKYYAYTDQVCYVRKVDSKTGETAWDAGDDGVVTLSTSGNHAAVDLETSACTALDFWIYEWSDTDYSSDENGSQAYRINRLNFDGTFYGETTGIQSARIAATPTLSYDGAAFVIDGIDSTASLQVYDLSGRLVDNPMSDASSDGNVRIAWTASPGVYLATLRTDSGAQTIKILVK